MKTTDSGYINKNNQKISVIVECLKPTITKSFLRWNVLTAAINILQMVVMYGLENALLADWQNRKDLLALNELKEALVPYQTSCDIRY